MMKTKMIYMILLFSSILFGGCVRDVIDDVPGTDEDYAADKKDVVLIRMGSERYYIPLVQQHSFFLGNREEDHCGL